MMTFEDKLRNYAQLGLIHGLGLDQKLRPLYIESYQTEDPYRFIPVLAREAYVLGVETVDVRCYYPELEREQFIGAPQEHKLYIPGYVSDRAREIVDRDGARIALNGNGDLGIMDDVDPKYPSIFHAMIMKANEPLTARRMKMVQPWNILDVPTIAWAKKLNMSVDDLWEFLFTITGADQEDSIGYARSINKTLHRRCALLNKLGIRKLLFRSTDGITDLTVHLSEKARWLGGTKQTPDGTWFEPNWPSFEVFTTPDCRHTEGRVKVTMPSVLGGQVVDGLTVEFKHGRIVDFHATQGEKTFQGLIDHDGGSKLLGEIALVGLDAPLAKYSEPHYCTMLDENKRCHMAVGGAYAACLEDGTTASNEELTALGCNDSDIHHDMMISDENTSVVALGARGQVTQLMENGHWLHPFDCKS